MNIKIALISTIFVCLVLFFNNCGGPEGTSTGNPFVEVHIASFDPAAKLTPQSVSGLTVCFKRIRFKGVNPTRNLQLELSTDLLTLDPAGTALDTFNVPSGTYDRVDLDLDDHCAGGKSLQLTNDNGAFSTSDHISIRFDGTMVIGEGTGTVDLFIQSIVTALQTVSADNQIRPVAESVGGSCNSH